MINRAITICLFFFLFPQLHAFEKLKDTYLVAFGKPEAPIHIVEYFSLNCPKCLTFVKGDFLQFKQKYIDTDQVYWVFHPDPSDLLTLQLIVCLEKLTYEEKVLFFTTTVGFIDKKKDVKVGAFVLQTAMDFLQKPMPLLEQLDFLEETEAFQQAYRFLKQPDLFTLIPSVEINGTLHDEFPSLKFLEKQVQSLMKQKGVSNEKI